MAGATRRARGRQPEFSEMPSPLTIESAGRCQKLASDGAGESPLAVHEAPVRES